MKSLEITLLCFICGYDKVKFRNMPDVEPEISGNISIPTDVAETFEGVKSKCPKCGYELTARLNWEQLPPLLDTV